MNFVMASKTPTLAFLLSKAPKFQSKLERRTFCSPKQQRSWLNIYYWIILWGNLCYAVGAAYCSVSGWKLRWPSLAWIAALQLELIFCNSTAQNSPEVNIRWVSVVEFHDGALGIGKVFGQESTVVKWNSQMSSLHLVTVFQKGPILDFQSKFSMLKIIRIFLKKIFIEEYQ